MLLRQFARRGALTIAVSVGVLSSARAAVAQAVVPGTGYKIEVVGDDFEDPEWAYVPNDPKSSQEQDDRSRSPGGWSKNGRWIEGVLRGQPDDIRRVETPEGGLPGSDGAMLIRTLHSGVPGRLSGEPQQDDLLASVTRRIGGFVPAEYSPSVVTRVYVPPFDEWEPRSAVSFGFRLAVQGRKGRSSKVEPYWPGIFIRFYSKRNGYKQDSAALTIRGSVPGGDVMGPKIAQPGWWTLGMSVSPDGQVHYYARPGVDDLRAEDRIASYYPYGFRAERLQTFFFDVCNLDNGRSWSTPWIVDDTYLYATRQMGATQPLAKKPASGVQK